MISAQERIIGRCVREALHLPDPFVARSALLLEPDLLQGHSPLESGPSPEDIVQDRHLSDDVPIL